jgi:hypothetical protein
VAEGDPGESLLGVLVLQGMGEKGVGHSGDGDNRPDRPGCHRRGRGSG